VVEYDAGGAACIVEVSSASALSAGEDLCGSGHVSSLPVGTYLRKVSLWTRLVFKDLGC